MSETKTLTPRQEAELAHKSRIQLIAKNVRSQDFVDKIQKVVPEGAALSFADKIAMHVINEVSGNKNLAQCSWPSIQTCILECSALGLFPSKLFGHVYLIPFKEKATIIIGYKGLIQLLLRNPQVAYIHARVVRSQDEFNIAYGSEEKLVHVPNLKEKGDLTHVYAIITYKDGKQQFEVMDRSEIDKVKATSKSSNFWGPHYEAMALKTVIRRLAKYTPTNSVYEKALEVEQEDFKEAPPTYQGEYQDTNSDDFLISKLDEGMEDE